MDDESERLFRQSFQRSVAEHRLAHGMELRGKLSELAENEKALVFRMIKQVKHLSPNDIDGCYHLQIDGAQPQSHLAALTPKTRRFTESPMAKMDHTDGKMTENETLYQKLLDRLVALDVLASEDMRRKRVHRSDQGIFVRISPVDIQQLSGLTGVRAGISAGPDPSLN